MKVAITAMAALLAVVSTPSPAPTPDIPVYSGNAAVRMALVSRPMGFDADGNARWLVVSRFFDAQGKPTRILANSDFEWTSRDGYVQWQTRLRYGQPAAVLRTTRDGPLTMVVHANIPNLGTELVHTDTRTWRGPRVVARALGSHAIQIGWFPQERHLARIVRVDSNGHGRTLAVIPGPSSSYRDTSVLPGRRYRYILYRAEYPAVKLGPIMAMPSPQRTAIANVAEKGMWLYFTSDPLDPLYYRHLDPQAVVAQAVRAGLHYVELRLAYGAYWEVSPQAKPTIDAIIDGLASHGIKTIAWTVPRETTFEDVRTSVRAAYYRTANGTPVAGLAPDIERGPDFMGDAPGRLDALWQYVRSLREALGPHYLIVPAVEDAYLEHLDNEQYPFRQIARYANVLQPMAYWRMMRRTPTTPDEVKVLLHASYEKLLREAGRTIPISIGGQTDAEGPNGYPPAAEITASLEESKALGAIGECFFAFDGTQPYQWNALSRYHW
ncbi:MAG: hypothetical protein ACYDGM_05520 [Vulcanimicrobiaceae bacterium]